mgnify:CR=1 FL=1
MDFIIMFFRDILDGPLYIIVAIISGILICSCIGYMAEVSLNKKKAKKEYEESHANLSSNQSEQSQVSAPISDISTPVNQPQAINQTVPSQAVGVKATTIPTQNLEINSNINQQPMNVNSTVPEMGVSHGIGQPTTIGGISNTMPTSAINNIPIPGNNIPNTINTGVIPPTITQTEHINNNQ